MNSVSYREYASFRYEEETLTPREDCLLIEQPLSICINDEPWTLTMQTPGNEIELAAGLAFTEGVVQRQGLVAKNFELRTTSQNSTVNISVSEQLIRRDEMRKRTLLSLSSCGICGRTELPLISGSSNNEHAFNPEVINEMLVKMQDEQTLFLKTGGCHAASAFDRAGQLIGCREDIGRHNAVDKLIGKLLLEGRLEDARAMTVSSRISYEIVVKCYAAAIPVLVAVSAPSTLAVDMAKEFGMSLYAFCRNRRVTRYA